MALLYSIEGLYCIIYIHVKFLLHYMSQPLWILKTAKEKQVQRLVHMSADLARQMGLMLEDIQNGITGEVIRHALPLVSLRILF